MSISKIHEYSSGPFVRVFIAFLAVVLGSEAMAQGQEIKYAYPSKQSVPAGPFSQVQTADGYLYTSVPLFSVKGPGDISLDCAVNFKMNSTDIQLFGVNGFRSGSAGHGWYLNHAGAVTPAGAGPNGELAPFMGGNMIGLWAYNATKTATNGFATYDRRATTVDQIRTIPANYGGNTANINEYVIESHGKRTTSWYYKWNNGLHVFGGTQDSYGNRLEALYGTAYGSNVNNLVGYPVPAGTAPPRLKKVQMAGGKASYEIWYTDPVLGGDQAYACVDYIRLTVGDPAVGPVETRDYKFEYYTNTRILKRIHFPNPDTGITSTAGTTFVGFDVNSAASYNLSGIRDLNGNVWTYTYETGPSFIRLKTVNNPLGQTTTFNYVRPGGTQDWRTDIVSPLSTGTVTTSHHYGNNPGVNHDLQYFPNPIVKVTDPTLVGRISNNTNWTYFETYKWNLATGELLERVDREGHLWKTEWLPGGWGLPVKTFDPTNNFSESTYENIQSTAYPHFRLKRTINPTGLMSAFHYNANHSVIRSVGDPSVDPITGQTRTGALNLETEQTFNSQGLKTGERTGALPWTTYSNFHFLGSPRSVTYPTGFSATTVLNQFGDPVSVTEPFPKGTVTTIYDWWRRPVRVTNPDTTYVESEYDLNGNTLSVRNELGYYSTKTYDALNRVLTERIPVNSNAGNDRITSYTYTNFGPVATMTNPNGKITQYFYNQRGELVRQVLPGGSTNLSLPADTILTDYDGNGKPFWVRNGRGQIINTAYNSRGLKTSVSYRNDSNSTQANNETVSFTYDASGKVTQKVESANGTYTYLYDRLERLTTYSPPLPAVPVVRSYDGNGRDLTLATGIMTWTYQYNIYNQLSGIGASTGQSQPVTYSYFGDGSINSEVMGNGTTRSYIYDNRGRATQIKHFQGSTLKSTCDYTYDAASNITYYRSWFDGLLHDERSNYYYDRSNRLTREHRNVGAYPYDDTFTYDKNNNRTNVVRNGVSKPYSIDNTKDQFNSGEGYSISGYDGDGNPTQLNQPGGTYVQFSHDALNKARWTYNGSSYFNYRYNSDGQRIERWGQVGKYRYVYDGDTIIAESHDYADDPERYFIPGIGFYDVASGLNYYFWNNLRGDQIALTYQNGSIQWRTEYKAYGEEYMLSQSTNPRSDFRFAGANGYVSDDALTGLAMLGQRYYHPVIGRFLTRDPIGYQGGINLYAYTRNSPIGSIDPSGEALIEIGFREVMLGRYHMFLQVTDNVVGSPTFGAITRFSYGSEHEGHLISPGKIVQKTDANYETDPKKKPIFGYVTILEDQSAYWRWQKSLGDASSSFLGKEQLYSGLRANSNASIRELMQRSGLLPLYAKAMKAADSRFQKLISPGFSEDPWGNYVWNRGSKVRYSSGHEREYSMPEYHPWRTSN